ncbi:hypothetical protein JHU38_08755 [Prevotella sp. A2931]|uniref:Glycine zipper domain-containing protein n=1 Tax=Prevotella illustrans TaxID=2800387 RepID=A0ABS3M6R2_9BACT|nr:MULTISPECIES: hypothetical protein [Prevotella]MBO1363855.1 hypothetical protein [Prevotella illustrans]PTL26272.1 hypothetical protein C3V39_03910 [Prevotella sp. oral taxon 820]
MNKGIIAVMSAALLVSGCGTYTGQGAYAGSTLGSILGSAIGGLSDGPRGSDVGTIVGMVGGAVVGAAIGNAADRQAEAEMAEHREAVKRRRADRDRYDYDRRQPQTDRSSDSYDSGFDPSNSGDDRIYDFDSPDYTGDYSAQKPVETYPRRSNVDERADTYRYTPDIEIRNARIVDGNQDKVISRGELCKVIFEVFNRGNTTLYDLQPTVVEANGNRHLYISPSVHVEKLQPGKGIRYTAMVKADNRLRDGMAKICVSVLQGAKSISKVCEFNVPTRK